MASRQRVDSFFPMAVAVMVVVVCLLSSLSTTVMSTKDFLTASEGDTVHLQCNRTVSSEPVDWKYLSDPTVGETYVGINGQLVIDYRPRFELSTVDYSLTINNTTMNDSGLYICTEESGIGQKHFRQLTVIGKRTSTQSVGYYTSYSVSDATADQALNSNGFMFVVIIILVVVVLLAVVTIIAMTVYLVSARRVKIVHQNHSDDSTETRTLKSSDHHDSAASSDISDRPKCENCQHV